LIPSLAFIGVIVLLEGVACAGQNELKISAEEGHGMCELTTAAGDRLGRMVTLFEDSKHVTCKTNATCAHAKSCLSMVKIPEWKINLVAPKEVAGATHYYAGGRICSHVSSQGCWALTTFHEQKDGKLRLTLWMPGNMTDAANKELTEGTYASNPLMFDEIVEVIEPLGGLTDEARVMKPLNTGNYYAAVGTLDGRTIVTEASMHYSVPFNAGQLVEDKSEIYTETGGCGASDLDLMCGRESSCNPHSVDLTTGSIISTKFGAEYGMINCWPQTPVVNHNFMTSVEQYVIDELKGGNSMLLYTVRFKDVTKVGEDVIPRYIYINVVFTDNSELNAMIDQELSKKTINIVFEHDNVGIVASNSGFAGLTGMAKTMFQAMSRNGMIYLQSFLYKLNPDGLLPIWMTNGNNWIANKVVGFVTSLCKYLGVAGNWATSKFPSRYTALDMVAKLIDTVAFKQQRDRLQSEKCKAVVRDLLMDMASDHDNAHRDVYHYHMCVPTVDKAIYFGLLEQFVDPKIKRISTNNEIVSDKSVIYVRSFDKYSKDLNSFSTYHGSLAVKLSILYDICDEGKKWEHKTKTYNAIAGRNSYELLKYGDHITVFNNKHENQLEGSSLMNYITDFLADKVPDKVLTNTRLAVVAVKDGVKQFAPQMEYVISGESGTEIASGFLDEGECVFKLCRRKMITLLKKTGITVYAKALSIVHIDENGVNTVYDTNTAEDRIVGGKLWVATSATNKARRSKRVPTFTAGKRLVNKVTSMLNLGDEIVSEVQKDWAEVIHDVYDDVVNAMTGGLTLDEAIEKVVNLALGKKKSLNY